jgi:hypothetical protein
VTFLLEDTTDPTEGGANRGGEGGANRAGEGGADAMLYSLRFENQLTVLSSLQFIYSPGSLGFENVSVVSIENTAFRYEREGGEGKEVGGGR